METIQAAIAWAQANWQSILAVWGAAVALATIVVKLTPTTKDDNVLAWVVKAADWLSVVNPKKPAETVEPKPTDKA